MTPRLDSSTEHRLADQGARLPRAVEFVDLFGRFFGLSHVGNQGALAALEDGPGDRLPLIQAGRLSLRFRKQQTIPSPSSAASQMRQKGASR